MYLPPHVPPLPVIPAFKDDYVELFSFTLEDKDRSSLRRELLEKIGTGNCSILLACGHANFTSQLLNIMETEGFMHRGEYIVIDIGHTYWGNEIRKPWLKYLSNTKKAKTYRGLITFNDDLSDYRQHVDSNISHFHHSAYLLGATLSGIAMMWQRWDLREDNDTKKGLWFDDHQDNFFMAGEAKSLDFEWLGVKKKLFNDGAFTGGYTMNSYSGKTGQFEDNYNCKLTGVYYRYRKTSKSLVFAHWKGLVIRSVFFSCQIKFQIPYQP